MARNILTRSSEFLGMDQKFWLLVETGGFGDSATNSPGVPTSGGIGHLTGNIEFKIPREDSTYRSGRSVVTRLSGKKEVKWNLESYLIPGDPDMSGNPTLSDAHPMLLTAFGAVDTSDISQIVYSLARTSTASFRMLEEATHFSRLAVGCVCDSITFNLPGDGKATMKAEGFGQDVYLAGQSVLASPTVSGNTLVLTTGQGGRFEVGGYVDVLDVDSNEVSLTTTARKITGISTDTLTVNGATFSAATGDLVIGYAPDFDADLPEDALLGLQGSFATTNMGSVDCQLLKAEITIKNNYTPKSMYYGTSKICGFMADKRRSVSVKLDVLLTKDNFEFYSNNKNFIADGLTIVLSPQDVPAPLNDDSGRTYTFVLPRVEFNVPSLEQPVDGFLKLSLEGTALSTDADTPDAELTLTIT